jgi:hypothetical protein
MKKFKFQSWFDKEDIRNETINRPMFLIELFQSGDYGHIHIRPVYETRTSEGEASFDFYSESDGTHVLSGLELKIQFGWTDKRHLGYGEDIGYNDSVSMTTVNLDRTAEKVKFLKSIAKELDKIYALRGSVKSSGEYVQRFAEALNGVEYFVVRTSNSYPYHAHRFIHVGDVTRVIDQAILNNEIGR